MREDLSHYFDSAGLLLFEGGALCEFFSPFFESSAFTWMFLNGMVYATGATICQGRDSPRSSSHSTITHETH